MPVFLTAILFAASGPAAPAPPEYRCRVSAADLAANARLGFEDFDQRGTSPSTARRLGERGCYAEAARATEDYLVNGPILDEYQRNVVRWHLGQYLASSGREGEAASVIASARRPVDPTRPDFDWNAYVVGTWAFLTRNRQLLEAFAARLSASPVRENAMNARVLRRLSRCFDQSYREAYEDPACDVPEEPPSARP